MRIQSASLLQGFLGLARGIHLPYTNCVRARDHWVDTIRLMVSSKLGPHFLFVITCLKIHALPYLRVRVVSIVRFRLYPASHVSGCCLAGLGKPKLILCSMCLHLHALMYLSQFVHSTDMSVQLHDHTSTCLDNWLNTI
jgi:hypothetical protein